MTTLVRSFLAIAILSALGLLASCGGGGTFNVDGGFSDLSVTCNPAAVQSGGTSQCTAKYSCTGKACNQVPEWTASAGSIGPFSGTFTAPQTDVSLPVTITGTLGSLQATTTVTVNP